MIQKIIFRVILLLFCNTVVVSNNTYAKECNTAQPQTSSKSHNIEELNRIYQKIRTLWKKDRAQGVSEVSFSTQIVTQNDTLRQQILALLPQNDYLSEPLKKVATDVDAFIKQNPNTKIQDIKPLFLKSIRTIIEKHAPEIGRMYDTGNFELTFKKDLYPYLFRKYPKLYDSFLRDDILALISNKNCTEMEDLIY